MLALRRWVRYFQRMVRAIAPSLLVLVLAAGCGGGAETTPEPETPAAPTPAPAKDEPKTEDESESTGDSEPTADTEPAADPEPEEEQEGPVGGPIQFITAPTVAFMIDYASSGAKEIAEAKCDKAFSEDLSARAACMKKERDEFTADVLRWVKDEKGQWWWYIYQRKSKKLNEMFKVKISFGEETKSSVEVKLEGGEKGGQVILAGKKTYTVKAPNNYSIVVEDKKFGRLPYSARLGLVGQKTKQ